MHGNRNDQKENEEMNLKICKKTWLSVSIPILVLESIRRGNRKKHYVRQISRVGELGGTA